MDEPIWGFWLGGLIFTIGGPFLFIHRDRIVEFVYGSGRIGDSKYGFPIDGSPLILPAIFAPPMGLFILFYAADRTFGWGITS